MDGKTLYETMQHFGQEHGHAPGQDYDELGDSTKAMLEDSVRRLEQLAGQPDQRLDEVPMIQGSLLLDGDEAQGAVVMQVGSRVMRFDAEDARSIGAMLIDAGAEAVFDAGVFRYMLQTGQNAEVAAQATEAMRQHRHELFTEPASAPPVDFTPEAVTEPLAPSREEYDVAMTVLKTGAGGEAAVENARALIAQYEAVNV